MKISLVTLSIIIFISSITQTFAQKAIVEKIEVSHSLEAFKRFFKDHKNPSPDLIKKTFGEPVLYTLFIGDAIARQKGQFKLTADRAAWCYKLEDKDIHTISIQVLNNKIYNVYALPINSKVARVIRESSEKLTAPKEDNTKNKKKSEQDAADQPLTAE